MVDWWDTKVSRKAEILIYMTDKIICFGKNYLDHMHELGDQPVDQPVIFLKPFSILKQCDAWNKTIRVTMPADILHYECELVFKVTGDDNQLTHYTVGLDMTKRELQARLKKAGHPWEISKIFLGSAIIGPWIPIDTMEHCLSIPFQFFLNQTLRQEAAGNQMLFAPIDLLEQARHHFPICDGDIIFTGTPAGVGAVKTGDKADLKLAEKTFSVIF